MDYIWIICKTDIYIFTKHKTWLLLGNQKFFLEELVMDVVMDMVVLEVEVMRSVMKKTEEGSGHRIDDSVVVMVMIILRIVFMMEVLVVKCSNAVLILPYLWSAVRDWNHSSAHLMKLSSVQGIRGEVTPQPTFTGWPSISTKHEALNPSPRIFCNIWFCASISIREGVKKID